MKHRNEVEKRETLKVTWIEKKKKEGTLGMRKDVSKGNPPRNGFQKNPQKCFGVCSLLANGLLVERRKPKFEFAITEEGRAKKTGTTAC